MNEHFDLSKCNEQGLRNLRMMCWTMGWTPVYGDSEPELGEMLEYQNERGTDVIGSPEEWDNADGFVFCYGSRTNAQSQVYPTPPGYDYSKLVNKYLAAQDFNTCFNFTIFDAQGRRRELSCKLHSIQVYLSPLDEQDMTFDEHVANVTKKKALAKLTADERKILGL